MPKKTCLNCQFLCTYGRLPNSNHDSHYHLDEKARERLAQAESVDDVPYFYSKNKSLKCYHDVWDQNRAGFKNKEILKEELVKDREDYCFWLEHKGNMGFPAAVQIQEKEEQKQEFKKEINLTRESLDYAKWGIWVTAGVGIGSLILEIIRMYSG